MKLQNKVAVITGGNSGIGLAIAREFQENGSKIVIFGRSQETLERAAKSLSGDLLVVKGDVRKLGDLDHLFEQTAKTFGEIDVLVANAGIAKFAPIESMPEHLFDELSDILFKGLFFTVQKALPHMRDGASIILVGSADSDKLGRVGTSIYSAVKAAVRSLARSMSVELLPRQRAHGGLCGRVDGGADPPELIGISRSNEDDGRAVAHMRQCLLHREEQTFEENVGEFVKKVLRHALDGSEFRNPGVRHQHIDFAERLCGLLKQMVKIAQLADIALYHQQVTGKAFCGSLESFLAAAKNDYFRPVFLELPSDRQPDTAISAGDYGHFVLELHKCAHFRSLIMLTGFS